jgi:hypothetical protein
MTQMMRKKNWMKDGAKEARRRRDEMHLRLQKQAG